MNQLTLLFSFFLFTYSTYAQVGIVDTATTTQTDTTWMVFHGETYTIQYPDDWDLDTSQQMMTKFILFSQQENEADLFKENINLIIQDIGKRSITLRQFAEGTQNQVESMLENSEIFVNERKEKKGSVFQRMVYSGTTSNRLLQFEQYFWVKKNLIYILTLTCDKDKFEAYQTIGEKILDSFEFTPIK